jgi:sugar porter (SP) family MFS transporter
MEKSIKNREAKTLGLDESPRGSLVYLSFVCLVAAVGGLLFGFDTAVISGTIGFLRMQFSMNPSMEGWLVSSALLGCVIGAAMSGSLSDRFGRKKMLIASGFLFIACAVGCGLAPNVSFLIFSRVIGGIGVGIASMVSPLYISEISPPTLRGRMVTLYQFAITIGICVALFSNACLREISAKSNAETATGLWKLMVVDEVWRGMLFAGVFPSILFTLLCCMIPESPRWLVKAGFAEKAFKILSRVAVHVSPKQEIEEIKDAIAHEGGSIKQLFQPGLRKALMIGLFLAIVSELSGITVVFYYGPDILEKAGFKLGAALGGFVTIGLVNVIFTVIAIWLMDKAGRRALLFWGNMGCFAALLAIAILFATGHTAGLILVLMMCMFVACFAFSMGPIKWVVMSEIFPTRIRGRAMAIATLAVWVTDGVLNQLFPVARESLGVAGTFFLFAAFLIPQFFFVVKVMPETKNRTLEEIESSWIKK